jgi:hypothetical protein
MSRKFVILTIYHLHKPLEFIIYLFKFKSFFPADLGNNVTKHHVHIFPFHSGLRQNKTF